MFEGEKIIEADEKLEAMCSAVNRIAHDYNNFLAAVQGYADLILRDLPQDSQNASDIKEIKSACEKMALFNKKLLCFARRKEPALEEINLSELLDQDSSYFSKKCSNHTLKINKTDSFVKGSSDQIIELLSELIENACIFSPPNSQIEITCGYDSQSPFLSVKDRGPGLGENPIKFFYPYETTKPERQGWGLSKAYGIAVRHKAFFKIIKTKEFNEVRLIFGR
ncbi:MAG: HAMP domain-containing sensor histidine kinase [Elusimicrobiota bacterium]